MLEMTGIVVYLFMDECECPYPGDGGRELMVVSCGRNKLK